APDRGCAEETEASLAGCSCWPEAEGESSFTGSDPEVWLAHRHCTYKQDSLRGRCCSYATRLKARGVLPKSALNSREKCELSENPQLTAMSVMASGVFVTRHFPYCKRSMRCTAAGVMFKADLKIRSSCRLPTPTCAAISLTAGRSSIRCSM